MSAKGKGGAKAGGKKGKDKQKIDPNKLNNVNKQFYELTIADLNGKLAHLRKHLITVVNNHEDVQKKLHELEHDHTDVAAHLDKMCKERDEVIENLEATLTMIVTSRDSENAENARRIKELESKCKAMKEQLGSELKLLTAKLNALTDFQDRRAVILAKFAEQDEQLHKMMRDHKAEVMEIEQKVLVEKDALAKDVERRLLEVSEDFLKAYESRVGPDMNCLMKENFALRKELDMVMDSYTKINERFEQFRIDKVNMSLDIESLQQLNHVMVMRNETFKDTVAEYEEKLEYYKNMLGEHMKHGQTHDKTDSSDSCERFRYDQAEVKLRKLGKIVERLSLEKNDLLAVHNAQEAEIKFLRDVLSKVKQSVEKAILPEEKTIFADSEAAKEKEDAKKNLMSLLLAIMASTRLPEPINTQSIEDMQLLYHPGQLGFVAGDETNPDLFHLMLVKEGERNEIDASMIWKNRGKTYGPDVCRTGNSLQDIEVGSNYYTSSSEKDDKVDEEPQESVDDEDESGSGDDKDEIICGKEEDIISPRASGMEDIKSIDAPSAANMDESIQPESTMGEGGIDDDIAEYFFY